MRKRTKMARISRSLSARAEKSHDLTPNPDLQAGRGENCFNQNYTRRSGIVQAIADSVSISCVSPLASHDFTHALTLREVASA